MKPKCKFYILNSWKGVCCLEEKLALFSQTELWDSLFPKFYRKGINADVMVTLSQEKYRIGLAKMIEAGEYKFYPPREVSIPKDGGGTRQIFVMTPLDRCVMSVVTSVYVSIYGNRVHPACVSYKKGTGVGKILHNLMPGLGCGGYKVDLSKYFDSVPIGVLEDVLKSMDTGSPLDKLLWSFYHDGRIIREGCIVDHYKSLAQGCAFSSLLANLCLYSLDEELSGICDIYLRYCDDILLLGPQVGKAYERLKAGLEDLGLSLNPGKVVKIDGDSVFDFLGGKVCRQWVHLADKSMKKQKKAVKAICKSVGIGEKAQRKAVQKVRDYFLKSDSDGHCVAEWLFSVCTDTEDLKTIDEYAKDQLKAVLTGKQNHTTNAHKTSNGRLKKLGWVSLVSAYQDYHYSPFVFKAHVKAASEKTLKTSQYKLVDSLPFNGQRVNLKSGLVRIEDGWCKIKRKYRKNLGELLETIWPLARLYEGQTTLLVSPVDDAVYSFMESEQIRKAVSQMELLVASSEWIWESQYFWQSDIYKDLVIFKEWFN